MGHKSKRKKQSARQAKDLRNTIRAFPPELEPMAQNLYELVYHGANPVLSEVSNPFEIADDPARAARFVAAAHRGFARAQDEIVAHLTSGKECSDAELTLCRKVMDGAAWQMIGEQLYLARRLFLNQQPPSLVNSNYETVRDLATRLTSADFSKFALMSDLTSFVQIGDLLVRDPDTGLQIVEVKEGPVNERILQFVHSSDTQCQKARAYFLEKEGERTFGQMGRMLRQKERMAHVAEVATNGDSIDPDTGNRVFVPDEPLVLKSWDEALVAVLEDSRRSGWAIEVVDNCLFLGAYREQFRLVGPDLFRAWLGGEPEHKGYPSTNLIQSMSDPLALPIFSRHLPAEHKFDILFGRAVVHVGLHVDAFIELCNESGLPARWSTRKEAGRFLQKRFGPWLLDHRAVLTGDGPAQGPIADGSFCRMFFHGTRPITIVEMLGRLGELADARTESETSP
jgi:hypothetical protein